MLSSELTELSNQLRLDQDSPQDSWRSNGEDVSPVKLDGLVGSAILLVYCIPPSAPITVVELGVVAFLPGDC